MSHSHLFEMFDMLCSLQKMTNLKADASQFEAGQIISQPESLPGCVQVARLRNERNSAKRVVVVKKYQVDGAGEAEAAAHIQHEADMSAMLDVVQLIQQQAI